jgi:DNA processing protein
MKVSRRILSLALATTRGIGGRTVSRVLARNDVLGVSPEEFVRLREGALCEEYRFTKRVASEWVTRIRQRLEEAIQLSDRLDSLGVTWVTLADLDYPCAVEEMAPDPPGVLFLYGNTKLLDLPLFCVLSSRKSPPVAMAQIEAIAEAEVLAGKVLVSSHDTPEYQRSAVVPLRWGAPRVLILDRGLFPSLGENLDEEPFAAARMWRYQFDPVTDLVISPVKPEVDFQPRANQARDQLVAGLSRLVVLVWPTPGGMMERLGRLALKAGRRVQIADISPMASEFVAMGAERRQVERGPE